MADDFTGFVHQQFSVGDNIPDMSREKTHCFTKLRVKKRFSITMKLDDNPFWNLVGNVFKQIKVHISIS